MKLHYEKPMFEIEEFELTTAIATGCTNKVSLGPGDTNNPTCEEYAQGISLLSTETNFYEGSCSCTYSAVGGGLVTS